MCDIVYFMSQYINTDSWKNVSTNIHEEIFCSEFIRIYKYTKQREKENSCKKTVPSVVNHILHIMKTIISM